MSFISYANYLSESDKKLTTITKKGSVKNDYGFIDYYYEVSDKYPEGILVDLGGFVNTQHRNKGIFKDLLKKLLSSVPYGTMVHMSVINPKLFPLFKRIGFKKVKEIEYWGKTHYAVKGIVTKEMINLI